MPRDINTDNEGNSMWAQGDLYFVDDSTLLHQRDILIDEDGEDRSAPFSGVGIGDYLDDEADNEVLESKIRQKLKADGMQVAGVSVSNDGKVVINAHYNK